MPLTDTTVRNTKPTNKTLKKFDSGGLYLEVSPNGGKWWRLKYRFHGKEKRISLGVYPDVSLKVARDRRGDARTLLADGIDPSQHRKTQKQEQKEIIANTFEALAREWYEKKSTAWTERHARDVMRVLAVNVFPWLGGQPVAKINPKEVLTTLRRIEERGKLHTAHRTLSICSQVFRYAVATGRAVSSIRIGTSHLRIAGVQGTWILVITGGRRPSAHARHTIVTAGACRIVIARCPIAH